MNVLVALYQTYDATDISIHGESHNAILPSRIHHIFFSFVAQVQEKELVFVFWQKTNENTDDLFTSICQAVTAESNMESWYSGQLHSRERSQPLLVSLVGRCVCVTHLSPCPETRPQLTSNRIWSYWRGVPVVNDSVPDWDAPNVHLHIQPK